MRVLLQLALAGALAAQQFLPRDPIPPVGGFPHRVHALDVDADGDLDLVVSNLQQQPDRLFRNDGAGGFTDASAALPPGVEWTRDVALGDVDGDRRPDLVLAKGMSPRLYLASGSGFVDATSTHMPPLQDFPHCVALADVDVDGDLDLFVGDVQSLLLRNDGSGHFAIDSAFRGVQTLTTALAEDFDHDGDIDFVTNGYDGRYGIIIYVNDGTGRFTQRAEGVGGDRSGHLALGDVDGDGDVDLLIPRSGINADSLWLRLNDGRGTFTTWISVPTPTLSRVYTLALTDLDADGDLDLVFGGVSNGIVLTTWYRNVGGRDLVPSGVAFRDLRTPDVGDIDGDGDPDVVVLHNTEPPRALVNLHRHIDAPLPARIGQPWALDLYDRPGYASNFSLAVPFVAENPARIPLPPLGTVFVDPRAMYQLPPVYLPPGIPQRLAVTLPPSPDLVGRSGYAQAVIVEPFGAVRLTNCVRAPIGR